MTHYMMTHEEHTAARDYMPEMICRTGDGHSHKDATRVWKDVTCIKCLAHSPNRNVRSAVEFAERIKSLGFRVFLAKSNTYGFITDETESRVLSFSLDGPWSSLSGNYGPPSRTSGTGWKMNALPFDLQTAEQVKQTLYAHPPQWCGNGWKSLTTVAQHMGAYGPSSQYREV